MQVERIISRGQLVCLKFEEDAVAASQTDAQLAITNATGSPANNEYIMPFAGSIIAISCGLSAAATAGSLTVGPTIDGTEKAALRQTITTQTEKYQAVARDAIAFVAGDAIGAEITTDGSWDGTSSDLIVLVWCLVDLEGI